MSVALIASANLVSSTATVLQENLAVVVLVNATQAVLENHVLMMATVLLEKPVVMELINVPQVVLENRALMMATVLQENVVILITYVNQAVVV